MGMESQILLKAQRQLDRFCRQYLQVQLNLDYPDEEHLRNAVVQQAIYSRLFADHAIAHVPPPRYQLRVLKELVNRIEQSIQDWEEEGISDNLMDALSSLFFLSLPSEAASAQQKSYVTYTLSSLPSYNGKTPTITLLEAQNMVAASGTTGLRTWEAALHLSSYLITNASTLVTSKSILELGAGTGFISILCSLYLGAFHVLATDGSSDIVSSLSTNFYLNGLQSSPIIQASELTWGWALTAGEHPEWNAGRKIDVVLGADLTYDASEIPALVGTFEDLWRLNPEVKIVYAATVRNPKTYETFLKACRGSGFVVEEIEWPMLRAEEQMGPFYSDKISIQLCMITRTR